MKFDIWSLILFVSIVQGLFFGILVFIQKKGNKAANKLLSTLLFILAALLLESFLIRNQLGYFGPDGYLVLVALPMYFLIAPIYFYYVKTSFGEKLIIDKTFFLNFLLPILVLINFIPSIVNLLVSAFSDTQYVFNHSFLLNINGYLYMGLFIIQLIIYVTIVYIYINHREWIFKENISDSTIELYRWFKRLAAIMIVIAFMHILAILQFIVFAHIVEIEYLLIVSFSITTWLVAFYVLKYRDIFISIQTFGGQKKYEKTLLETEKANQIAENLLSYMENEKPYLKSKLHLSDLAAELNITTNQLSQVINNNLNKSFFDFINEYRVREFKDKINDPKFRSYSILGLAVDSGFNNKTTFNRVFKKLTGKTPSAFVNNG